MSDIKIRNLRPLDGEESITLHNPQYIETPTELTINSAEIVITGGAHTVDTENDDVSDELDTISGAVDGQMLQLYPEDPARVVTLRHGVGNIELSTGADMVLTAHAPMLRYDAGAGVWRDRRVGAGALANQDTVNNSDWSGDDLDVEHGGTGASTTPVARQNLGLEIGVDVQAHSNILDQTTAPFQTADETKLDYISVSQAVNLDQVESDATAAVSKTTHIAVTQAVDLDDLEARVDALDAVVILKGDWDASVGTFPGGGTAQAGHSYIVNTAGTVDGVSFDINDRVIAITDNASTTIYAGNWVKTASTDSVLSVGGFTGNITLSQLGLVVGSDIQAHSAKLDYIAGLTPTDNNFLVGNGSNWAKENAATARGSLGLGSLAVRNDVNNDHWSGTDLSIANGGTGASTAATARANLGLGSAATKPSADFVSVYGDDMNGQLRLYAGNANYPGLAFATDNNTGIYKKASNQIGLATAGGLRVWVGNGVVLNGTAGGDKGTGSLNAEKLYQNGVALEDIISASGGGIVKKLYAIDAGTIVNQSGITSLVRNGKGVYTVTFNGAMPNSNYIAVVQGSQNARVHSRTTTGCVIHTQKFDADFSDFTILDLIIVSA